MRPYQAPPSMEFSRQKYWSGLPFPSPGDLPDPGIKPRSPTLQAGTLPSEPPGKPIIPRSQVIIWQRANNFYPFLPWTTRIALSVSVLRWLTYSLEMIVAQLPNSTQCSVAIQMGGKSKKEGIYAYAWLIHFAAQQNLTQHCKTTILQ